MMRCFAFSVAIAVLTLSLLCSVLAQTAGLDPVKNMCIRLDHQSTIKNDVLYIDGGTQTFVGKNNNGEPKGDISLGYNNYLIAVNMSTSWDWKRNISEAIINKTANPRTGTTPPVVVRGALYQGAPSDNNIYLYGGTTSYLNISFPGFHGSSSNQYSLWSYDTVANDWNQYDITNASSERLSSGAYAEAPDQGLAFYFNGQIDNGSSVSTARLGHNTQVFVEGMLVIDTNNQTARNLSTNQVTGNYPRVRGKMQYVPGIGDKGILVYLGGRYEEIANFNDLAVGNLVSLDTIDIFDISSMYNGSSGTWYQQKAEGDIPAPRVDHCLVMASAADNSSHNIYMYGGRASQTQIFDQIYVLSLPSFTWTKIFEGSSPRYGMTCHFVGNRQMLTVGGWSSADLTSRCDWEEKGVAIYDMSSLTWGSVFDCCEPYYTVPEPIIKTIGGVANGSANMTRPMTDWANVGIATLFKSTLMSNETDNSSSTSTGPFNPSGQSGKSGEIVGGIIGGVAGLTLILGTIWFLMPERRKVDSVQLVEADSNVIVEKDASNPHPSVDAEVSIPEAAFQRVRRPTELGPVMKTAELPGPFNYAELP